MFRHYHHRLEQHLAHNLRIAILYFQTRRLGIDIKSSCKFFLGVGGSSSEAYFGCSQTCVYFGGTQAVELTDRNEDTDDELCAVEVAGVPREEAVKKERRVFEGKVYLFAEIPERIGTGYVAKKRKVQT